MSELTEDARSRLASLRLLVCDVDGVLTDGQLTYDASGVTTKTFSATDGMGLRLLLESGIEVGIITARDDAAVACRMRDLGIAHVLTGRGDKGTALRTLLTELQIPTEQVAYMGDDVLDLPAMSYAGIGITVSSANPFVQRRADWVTQAAGGQGAVREVADTILEHQGGLAAQIEALLTRINRA